MRKRSNNMVNFFNIGMTKSEVMSKLGTTHATDKTKQFIQNFWSTDRDGKITNEIELTMLESWANGSEKVKMPTQGEKKTRLDANFDDGSIVSYYTSKSGAKHTLTIWDSREKFIMHNNKKVYIPSMLATWNGNRQQDELFDKDGDGYADYREYQQNSMSLDGAYRDTKMDGRLKSPEELEQ